MKTFLAILLVLVLAGCVPGGDPMNPSHSPAMNNSNSQAMAKGNFEVKTQTVGYYQTTKGFLAEPAKSGQYPGVVLIQEWWGLTDQVKEAASTLASHGYRVLAVDLYHGKVATNSDQARAAMMTVNNDDAVANLRAAAQYLRAHNSSKIASFGWCFGGGKSLQLALSGEPLDATIIYYGQLETDPDKLAAIDWPVLGIFGGQDQSISASNITAFQAGLNKNSITNEIKVYPNVGHAFANPSGANYAPQETSDAWNRTLVFLKKTVG